MRKWRRHMIIQRSHRRSIGLGVVILLLVGSACAADGNGDTSTTGTAALQSQDASVRDGDIDATEVEVEIDVDVAYGPDDRHRVDVYHRAGLVDAPTIVVVHGGGWAFGDKRDIAELATVFAQRGFVAAAPNYRLVGSDGQNAFPVGAQDVACAAAWLADNAGQYGGDPSTMLATGYSAGGHLAAMLALDAQRDWLDEECPHAGTDLTLDAYIGFSAPYDLRVHAPLGPPHVCNMLKDVVGGEGTECFDADPRLFESANPVDNVTPDDPPALVITGDMDCKISFPPDPETGLCTASPDAFVAALEASSVPFELLVLPGVVHDIDYGNEQVLQAMDTFLQEHGFTDRD